MLSTMDGRGAFPESHPRWAGVMTGSWVDNTVEMEVIERADAVLFAGADAMMAHVPWSSPLPVCELVARPGYLSFTPEPEVRVDGDLKASIAQLTTAGDGFFEAELAAIDAVVEPHFARPPHARLAAQDIIEIARELMPPRGVLFSETGIYITILERLWKVDDPASYRGTSGGRTMGLTIPAILGAKLAAPETPMMGLGADGSLLMRLGELETLARAGVAVPLVILNDDAPRHHEVAAEGARDAGVQAAAAEGRLRRGGQVLRTRRGDRRYAGGVSGSAEGGVRRGRRDADRLPPRRAGVPGQLRSDHRRARCLKFKEGKSDVHPTASYGWVAVVSPRYGVLRTAAIERPDRS